MLKLKPILWPPDVKNWLTGKDPDGGKDWRQEKKGTTQDKMVRWHHRLNGHEFEQASGVDDGQGSLACSSPWGCKELDTTEWLNWTVWFWHQSNAGLVKWVWKCFLLFCSLFVFERFQEGWAVGFNPWMFARIHQWYCLPLNFYLLGSFWLSTQSVTSNPSVWIFYSFIACLNIVC